MTISVIFISAILILSLSVVLFSKFSSSSKKDISRISAAMMNQSYRKIDTQLMAIYQYFARLNDQDDILFEARHDLAFDGMSMYTIGRSLKGLSISNPLIESVYVYNRQADLVFSSKTTAQKSAKFFDQDALNYFSRLQESQQPVFSPRMVTYQIYEKEEILRLVSLFFFEFDSAGTVDSALVINVDIDVLLGSLSDQENDNPVQIVVTTSSGNVVISPDPGKWNGSLMSESYFQRISKAAQDNGYFIGPVAGVPYLVSYFRTSKALDWYFLTFIEEKQLISGIGALRNYVLFLTGLFIMTTAILLLLMLRRLYRPVEKLVSRVKENTARLSSASSGADVELLSGAFEDLLNNVADLSKQLNESKPAKKREYLYRLVRGELTLDEESEQIPEDLRKLLGNPPFILCILRIDGFGNLSGHYSAAEIALLRLKICRLAVVSFSGKENIEVFDGKKDTVCLLLTEFGSLLPDGLPEKIADIQTTVKDELGLSLTGVIGAPVDTIEKLPLDFERALYVSEMRLTAGIGQVFRADGVPGSPVSGRQYPVDLEKIILDAIKLEDIKNYTLGVRRFLDDCKERTPDETYLLLTQLSLNVIKAAQVGGRFPQESNVMDIHRIAQRISGFDTLSEMGDWLISWGTGFISRTSLRKDKRREEMVQGTIEYIGTHYQDAMLTIDELADRVHLSVNHFRVVFKDIAGESISDYLTQYRFREAQRLLKGTDFSAKKIAEMVGFSNPNYFYISFKKLAGLSPEEYRKTDVNGPG